MKQWLSAVKLTIIHPTNTQTTKGSLRTHS